MRAFQKLITDLDAGFDRQEDLAILLKVTRPTVRRWMEESYDFLDTDVRRLIPIAAAVGSRTPGALLDQLLESDGDLEFNSVDRVDELLLAFRTLPSEAIAGIAPELLAIVSKALEESRSLAKREMTEKEMAELATVLRTALNEKGYDLNDRASFSRLCKLFKRSETDSAMQRIAAIAKGAIAAMDDHALLVACISKLQGTKEHKVAT
jgi:transcriptional regulator with XRE-family HTH domain